MEIVLECLEQVIIVPLGNVRKARAEGADQLQAALDASLAVVVTLLCQELVHAIADEVGHGYAALGGKLSEPVRLLAGKLNLRPYKLRSHYIMLAISDYITNRLD